MIEILLLGISCILDIIIIFILMKFYVLFREKKEKTIIEDRESMLMRMLIVLFVLCLTGAAQDGLGLLEPAPVVDSVDIPQPIVFPEGMSKAIVIIDSEVGATVDYTSQEDAWRLKAYEFLHGNNSSASQKKVPIGPKTIII